MKNNILIKKQPQILLVSSVAALVFFALLLLSLLFANPKTSSILELMKVTVFMIPMLVPAFFWLFYFRMRPVINGLTLGIAYSTYLVLNVLVYGIYFFSNDPIEAGLLFLILGVPVATVISIAAILVAFKNKPEEAKKES